MENTSNTKRKKLAIEEKTVIQNRKQSLILTMDVLKWFTRDGTINYWKIKK